MVAATIDVVLGIEPDLTPKNKGKGVCILYFTPKPGRLVSIENTKLLEDEHVYSAEIYHKIGDVIPQVRSSLNRSGHVIVTDETVQLAVKRADKLIKGVRFTTE